MSTLKRRLVSIGVIHKVKGHYLDTKHPTIIENLMGIRRRKGSVQIGKKPLLINSLKEIINTIDKEIFIPILFPGWFIHNLSSGLLLFLLHWISLHGGKSN